jgi:nucleoside-diphosphate-sugar epimerase
MMPSQDFELLICGCGYLGQRVAQRFLHAEKQVAAVTRKASTADAFQQLGIQPIVADVTDPKSLQNLPGCQTLLFAVGSDRGGPHSIFDIYVQGLRNVLQNLSPQVERVIYISSTGVYAQNDSGWIDESSPAESNREAARACLAAEQVLWESPFANRAIVLRLSGIYGPDRVPQREKIISGEPLATDPHSYLNLIHVDDGVSAVVAASRAATSEKMLLISDDEPVLRGDYYAEVARLYGAGPARFETASPDQLAMLRGGSSKRIRNARMKSALQFSLKYPTYREGLAASIRPAD